MATNEAENRSDREREGKRCATVRTPAHCCKMIFIRKTGGKVIKRNEKKENKNEIISQRRK